MKIEVLVELVQGVSLSEIRLKGRSLELSRILRKYPTIKDRDIILQWYGDDPSGGNYLWRIKQKLYQELIDFYLKRVPESFDRDVQKDYQHCLRANAVVNIMIIQYKRKTAVLLAEEAIKKAVKHRFTNIIISLASLLYRHYGVFAGDKKKAVQYSELLNQYVTIQNLEIKAQSYYTEVVSEFPKTKNVPVELIQKGKEYVAELRSHIGEITSYQFHLMTFNLIVAVEKMKGDNREIVTACKEANAYFEKIGDVRSGIRFIFNYSQIPPLIALQDFTSLKEALSICLSICEESSFNWVAIHQYKAISLFYQGEFESACDLLVAYKDRAEKHHNLFEMWLIMEAYAHAFTGRKYRLQKFLNEVPTYSKDKRGMNINLLLIQILFHLRRKQYGSLIDKTKALQHYATRYLYDDATLRSNCLIKLILLAEKYSFKRSVVEIRAASLWEKLQQAPVRDIDVEPVPYERLWEEVMGLLR